MFAASLFLACSAYSQSSLELDGVWISSASNARGVVQKKDDGSFVVTMSYPSGHSDIYLGIIIGSDISNLCSVKGVEPFYACFSATVDSTTLISATLESCEDTQGLDICAKLPSTLTFPATYIIRSVGFGRLLRKNTFMSMIEQGFFR